MEGVKEMVSVYFVAPYPPIMCGIADYTSFLVRTCPAGQCGVLSFDIDKYGAPLIASDRVATERVWYGIPGRDGFSAAVIREGLRELGARNGAGILWFQHEFDIWPDTDRFVAMLRELDIPKVVTFHSLHFQSSESPGGLRRHQWQTLQAVLPCVEAITVFSYGVYRAVISAFPQYGDRVHIVKHGVHLYPEISRLSRREAKERLNDFLLNQSDLDMEVKDALRQQRVFLDADTVILGETGFIRPLKQSELLYFVRDKLEESMPEKRIAAVRIGSIRDSSYAAYSEQLQREQDGKTRFLLTTWLPPGVFPLAQRAFDLNFHWPTECTQSGVLAHALGAGAVVAGRDLEGFGEALREAGELADTDLEQLITKIRNLIINPELEAELEETASRYATDFSWENQMRRHYRIAEDIIQAGSLQM